LGDTVNLRAAEKQQLMQGLMATIAQSSPGSGKAAHAAH
jgi:hypothetical protein